MKGQFFTLPVPSPDVRGYGKDFEQVWEDLSLWEEPASLQAVQGVLKEAAPRMDSTVAITSTSFGALISHHGVPARGFFPAEIRCYLFDSIGLEGKTTRGYLISPLEALFLHAAFGGILPRQKGRVVVFSRRPNLFSGEIRWLAESPFGDLSLWDGKGCPRSRQPTEIILCFDGESVSLLEGEGEYPHDSRFFLEEEDILIYSPLGPGHQPPRPY